MTRLQKGPGTTVLEHEYVYSDPPMSLTDLADKYGLARSGVAGKAQVGKWFEKREEFRLRLTEKTREALAEKWVEYETANREKVMAVAATYLDKFVEALNSGEIKVSTRDMLGIVGMQRQLLTDVKGEAHIDPVLVGPDGSDFDTPESAAEQIANVKRLMRGDA